jgi:hypothetical protein
MIAATAHLAHPRLPRDPSLCLLTTVAYLVAVSEAKINRV